METLDKALQQAKIHLMSKADTAFFTTVCFSLKMKWDENLPTAATNGREILFNPTFFMGLNTEERIFLLLHESMHVAYLHMDRRQTRDKRKWNIAADHVINLMLIARGFQMPKGCLADRQYLGMSTEEVYNLLPEGASEGGMGGDVLDPSGEPTELQREVEDILVRAQLHSQMENDKSGTIPGDIQIFLDNLLKPKLPWQRILSRHIREITKSDYTFKRPNRRYFPQHILPSLYSEKLLDLAIAVDSSGSVSDEEFKQFISEIHSVLRMMKPEKITLIQFDAAIRDIAKIKNLHDMSKVVFTGRGGTLIHPVINWAIENKPQVLLVFSDGDFDFYCDTCPGEVIWLIHNNPKFIPPYGKTIHYSI